MALAVLAIIAIGFMCYMFFQVQSFYPEDYAHRAQEIRAQAEADAQLERKKAEEDIRREIADVSAQLTEKLLEREIRPEDHRELIDSFLQELDG